MEDENEENMSKQKEVKYSELTDRQMLLNLVQNMHEYD